MDWFFIPLLWFLLLVHWGVLGRALLTGSLGLGAHAVRRADDPNRFWVEAALSAAASALLVLFLLRDPVDSKGRYDDPGISNLILAALLAFWLFRFLMRGTASAAGTSFSRAEEPTQYWLIIALTVAALALLLWVGLGFPV
jgi:hypothetical protein